MKNTLLTARQALRPQQGASLIMVMIVLTIVSILGIGAIQISMMSERGARNDRDQQMAWQGAEAALIDAQIDIDGSSTSGNITSSRSSIFKPQPLTFNFVDGCAGAGNSLGLCLPSALGKPVWLLVNLADATSAAQTTEYGAFTGRTFQAGGAGIQPAQKPRYIIELLTDPDIALKGSYVYRVTAMGFGPRQDIQAVLQIIYRPNPT